MLQIVLVEDDPTDVFLFEEALRILAIDAEVLVARDGEHGLHLLTEMAFKPNLIILDLNVPRLDAFGVLRRYNAFEGPPVVIFTSSLRPQDANLALALGAQELITKPVQWDAYIEAVHKMLKRWLPASSLIKVRELLEQADRPKHVS